MAFEKGNKIAKGRPKGSLNTRSLDFLETLEKHNFNPAEALIEVFSEAKKTYDNYATIYDAICDASKEKGEHFAPPEDKADKYLKICLDAAKDLAGYAYPKLKAIEQVRGSPLDGMTPEQKLEAMRQAVAALELQVKSGR